MAHDATASVVQWRVQDEVQIVTIDNPPVNALGAAVRQGLRPLPLRRADPTAR